VYGCRRRSSSKGKFRLCLPLDHPRPLRLYLSSSFSLTLVICLSHLRLPKPSTPSGSPRCSALNLKSRTRYLNFEPRSSTSIDNNYFSLPTWHRSSARDADSIRTIFRRKRSLLSLSMSIANYTLPLLVMVITFGSYTTLQGGTLTSAKVAIIVFFTLCILSGGSSRILVCFPLGLLGRSSLFPSFYFFCSLLPSS
jgi:hypothetical protein